MTGQDSDGPAHLPPPLATEQWAWLVQETFVGGDYEDNFLLQDFMIPLEHVSAAVRLRKVEKSKTMKQRRHF